MLGKKKVVKRKGGRRPLSSKKKSSRNPVEVKKNMEESLPQKSLGKPSGTVKTEKRGSPSVRGRSGQIASHRKYGGE